MAELQTFYFWVHDAFDYWKKYAQVCFLESKDYKIVLELSRKRID